MKQTIKTVVPVLILLALYLVLAIYLGSFKVYMYEDEVLSYTSANSQSGMYIHTEKGVWYDDTLVKNAITAVPGHCFDYRNTLKNSFADNHPPMYTMLIHTVCSFFPGMYSKWFGLIVNIIAGAGCVAAFYFLSLELFDRRKDISIAATLVFISSLGFVDTLLFIRNYIYFMLAVIVSMLLHLRYLQKKDSKAFYIMLYISTFFGMMSHYYFAAVLFYIASYYCLTLMFRKKWLEFGKYALTMIIAGGSVIIVLPDIIDDILHSESGSGNFAVRGLGDYIARYRTAYVLYNQELFGGLFKLFAAVVIVYLIFRIYKNRKIPIKDKTGIGMIMWTSVWYYIVGSATLTYLASRYLSPVFPFIILLIAYCCDRIASDVFKNNRVGLVVMVVLFMLPLYGRMAEGLTDHQKLEMLRIAENRSDDYCIFGTGIPIEENFFELEKYKGFMAISDDTNLNIREIADADELIIYAASEERAAELQQRLREVNPGLDNMERLYVAYYSNAYRLY